MPSFVLAIASVKTVYDTYRTDTAAVTAAQQAITDAGAEPTPPVVVLADADWNNYVTANLAWIATNTTLQGNLATAKATQRTAELAVIAALGYGTGDTPSTIALDEWVHVVGSGSGVLTYNHYIGAATNSTYLTISTILPTHAFPNV